jgi:hypothetical protein
MSKAAVEIPSSGEACWPGMPQQAIEAKREAPKPDQHNGRGPATPSLDDQFRAARASIIQLHGDQVSESAESA